MLVADGWQTAEETKYGVFLLLRALVLGQHHCVCIFEFPECIIRGVKNIDASDLAIVILWCEVVCKILSKCKQGMIAVSDPLKHVTPCVTCQCCI